MPGRADISPRRRRLQPWLLALLVVAAIAGMLIELLSPGTVAAPRPEPGFAGGLNAFLEAGL